ncbi:GNAT family N-acetyltransferase [Streptomyces anthocyanicus]|uniref:GNAT family N-acetyltransferase n=1 Tax=Streptomyces anthocyanicus TaxID=68174 RepID=UPI002DDAC7F0|nr:GNAT family N-acetyltransferase [Streptomyces anthocyanicus]WSB63563.1 GNAT family N-acetyltransferase [Streptomyces anthocyanicus]
MMVRLAEERDFPGFLGLAGQVEHWFGPMVEDAGFHEAVREHIRRGAALVAVAPDPDTDAGPGAGTGTELLGGLLFGTDTDADAPVHHVHWLVVSRQARAGGVGRALMRDAMRRWVRELDGIEVVTFGADHPGATESGARAFYERLGFTPAEVVAPGPEGGSRQLFRRGAQVRPTRGEHATTYTGGPA